MPKSQKQKTSGSKNKTIVSRKREAVSGKTAVDSAMADQQHKSVHPDTSELKLEDFADVSEESASIISIVKSLEEQVETAFKLKEALEAELNTTQTKLSEQLDARAQLEVQVKSLESKAALSEQLREDLACVEEDRNKFATQLARTQPQLEAVTSERDSLAKQAATAEEHTKKLEGEKIALEAQVMNLKDKITDTDRLQRELADLTEAGQNMQEKLRNLTKQLETSETSKDAFKKELADANQTIRSIREETETLRKKLATVEGRLADMRIQLGDQQAANRDLLQTKARLDNEVKMLGIKYEAAKNEVDALKNALRDIRSEISLTSGRVRQKYFKLNDVSNSKPGGKG